MERIYQETRAAVCGYLVYLGVPGERAQEVTQDVFPRLYQPMRQKTAIENPKAWVYRVARNFSTTNLMLGSGSPTTGLTPLFQGGGPRTVELSLRFSFDGDSRRNLCQAALISGASTMRMRVGGWSTACASACVICVMLTSPRRLAECRVGGQTSANL